MSGALIPVLMKFPAGLLGELDAAAGRGCRSEWVREAVQMRLSGAASVAAAPPVVAEPEPAVAAAPKAERAAPRSERAAPKSSGVFEVGPDARSLVLLSHLRKKPGTVCDAARSLGWPELLVSRLARDLVSAGRVHYPRGGGVMVAFDD